MRRPILLILVVVHFCITTTSLFSEVGACASDSIPKHALKVTKVSLPIGPGAANERLSSFRAISSIVGQTVNRIDLDLSRTTQLSDISKIYIYYNGKNVRPKLEEAILVATVTPDSQAITVLGETAITRGNNYFWITADVSENATEGNQIEVTPKYYYTGSGTKVKIPPLSGSRSVILGHSLLFSSGDYNSRSYRIPAMVTARDGSLVTVTDQRWNNQSDLPNHIDLVARRSTDKGQTWSSLVTIAGLGTEVGYGDAALICNHRNGEILCLFASGAGFINSTSGNSIRIMQASSLNNGISWTTPIDITSQIYGSDCTDPTRKTWQGAFFSSGTMTQLKNGRIIAALVVREDSGAAISTYTTYSDDFGQHWQVSPNRAAAHGNEAKIVERNNGDLLMSIRNPGYRLFTFSYDSGINWTVPFIQPDIIDPSCNGSLNRYTSLSEGYDQNRLLHSITYSPIRANLSVLLSYDEGDTWPVRKTIYEGQSAYSSISILQDGTIGLYYEVGEFDRYQMYFARFSLKWLTDGIDRWTPKRAFIHTTIDPADPNLTPLLIFPNPAKDQITIRGDYDPQSPVEIYHSSGLLVGKYQKNNTNADQQILLSDFTPGIYWLKAGQAGAWFVVQ